MPMTRTPSPPLLRALRRRSAHPAPGHARGAPGGRCELGACAPTLADPIPDTAGHEAHARPAGVPRVFLHLTDPGRTIATAQGRQVSAVLHPRFSPYFNHRRHIPT